jgi:hypothetical protein
MTPLDRCSHEAALALAAFLRTGDLGALMGWADWLIERDYILRESA